MPRPRLAVLLSGFTFCLALSLGARLAAQAPASKTPVPAAAAPAPPTAQKPATPPPPEPPSTDPAVAAGQLWIGRALILRGFYNAGELEYDAQGHVHGSPKTTDWTLAGFNLDKVSRKGDGELQLDGSRVAIRYNPDAGAFERHVQKQEKIRIALATGDSAMDVDTAMRRVFSIGIDRPLQLSMPPEWLHYFMPATAWGTDALAGQMIEGANGLIPAKLVQPVAENKLGGSFPLEAKNDKVNGTVSFSLVVDAEGIPRRIVIKQPLGYGIDARMAEALGKLRFHAATLDGKPVAVATGLTQNFDYVTADSITADY